MFNDKNKITHKKMKQQEKNNFTISETTNAQNSFYEQTQQIQSSFMKSHKGGVYSHKIW